MRAKTEEEHLSSDPDYIEYKKNVPYKFIPKIW
jgi:protein-S-isoprenylcysteine O-methyltransferase Ste14